MTSRHAAANLHTDGRDLKAVLSRRILILRIGAVLVLILLGACNAAPGKRQIRVGDQAPLFATVDLAGQPVDMRAYLGNPVILRFWSVDCKYCRADTPIFNRYFDKYRGQGLKVVYINSTADEKTVRAFVEDLEIGFPVVLDKGGVIAADYNVRLTPQTIVIGPDQKILAAVLGGVSETELQGLLGSHLH